MNGEGEFLLDTNVILGFLNEHLKVNSFFQQYSSDRKFYVSQISRMELLGYPKITSEEEACVTRFLSLTTVLPLSTAICDQAITLRRNTRLKLPDALIAATAICSSLVLVTCDTDLLSNIDTLRSINPILTSSSI